MPATYTAKRDLINRNRKIVRDFENTIARNPNLTNNDVYRILGELVVTIRTARNATTTNIAGSAVDFVRDNYLTAGEQALIS